MIEVGNFKAIFNEGTMTVYYHDEEYCSKSAKNSDEIEEMMALCFKLGRADVTNSKVQT